jgi:hypothetical protein
MYIVIKHVNRREQIFRKLVARHEETYRYIYFPIEFKELSEEASN